MADAGVYGRSQRARGERLWSDVAPPAVEHEDRLPEDSAREIWNEIYALFRAGDENAQREVKLAVYAYYAVNGASKRTKHSRDITTGGGASVISADVLNVIGIEQLRQFLRSNVDEAYSALKESEVLERDEIFASKAMKKGVPRGFLHCAVDFLRGCSLFTPEEEIYAQRHFEYSTGRARNARGGVTVDEEDDRARARQLESQRETSRVGRVITAGGADEF